MEHLERTFPAKPSFVTSEGDVQCSNATDTQIHVALGTCLYPVIKESLRYDWSLPQAGPIHYADFGCSAGTTTIGYAKFMAENLKLKPEVRGRDVFCYFCDLPSIDFNTLFNRLPPFAEQASSDESVDVRTWFAVGVPGSMFDRMFPRSSLHVAISTLAIHFLPEVPESIIDKSSPAYNKGRIWIPGSSPAVAAAYTGALRKGLRMFFEHRAKELAPGGLLIVLCPGRRDRAHPETQLPTGIVWYDVFQETWEQLISEEVIAEELLDSFNIPMCNPSLEELQDAIEQPTSTFHIQKLEFFENMPAFTDDLKETVTKDAESYANIHKHIIAMGFGSFLTRHLGPDVFDKFMVRLCHNHMKEYPRWKAANFPWVLDLCMAVLIRK